MDPLIISVIFLGEWKYFHGYFHIGGVVQMSVVLRQKPQYDVGQLSNMLNVDESKVIEYCQVLEKNGYLVPRNMDGNFNFTEEDITTLLCFFNF
jgi:hypothetical protein